MAKKKQKTQHAIVLFKILNGGQVKAEPHSMYKTWEGATCNQYGAKKYIKLSPNCQMIHYDKEIDTSGLVATVLVDVQGLVENELSETPTIKELITVTKVMNK